MKITAIQVHEAFHRAAMGKSVRSLAHELGVNESTLREHFRKRGTTPKQLRELAFKLFHAQQALARLDEVDRQAVEAEVKRRMS